MRIAILSRKRYLYSTQRLYEAAKERGHRVEVYDHIKCNLVVENNRPIVKYYGRNLSHIDAIIPRIGASVTYYGASVIRQFEMQKVFTTTPSDALLRSRDKFRSLQLLASQGIALPKTAFTHFTKDPEELIQAVGGAPLVIKLLEGTQGLGVVLAETNNAANSVIDAFNQLKARVIVQEFISEANGADIRALVVDGEVVGAMIRQAKSGEFRSNLHRGGSAHVIRLTPAEERTALLAAKVLGLSVCGVDMLQSRRGPLILEVNSSPGLEGIEGATGVDIAGKIINYIERSVPNHNRKKARRTF